MARDITSGNGRNQGNYGVHQQALVRLALALDEQEQSPTSEEMMGWVLANPRPLSDSDLGLVDALGSTVHRDGMPPESPGYNYLWTSGPAGIAELLGDRAPQLGAHPRLRRLLLWHFGTILVEHAAWQRRTHAQAAVFDGKLWTMGGGRWSPETVPQSDVWCSEDGVNWTELKSNVIWDRRHEHSAYVFEDKIRVAGGYAESLNSEVWTVEVPEGWFGDG